MGKSPAMVSTNVNTNLTFYNKVTRASLKISKWPLEKSSSTQATKGPCSGLFQTFILAAGQPETSTGPKAFLEEKNTIFNPH